MEKLFSDEAFLSDPSDSENDAKETDFIKPRNIVFHCAPESSIASSNCESLFVIDANSSAPCNEDGAVMTTDSNVPDNAGNVDTVLKPESSETTVKDKINEDDKSEYRKTAESFDTDVKKLLSRCQIGVGYEKDTDDSSKLHVSKKELWRRRKVEREKTKGSDWYNLPATEMTEERARDLEIIQMRDALDTKVHYKKNDRSVLPKYFEVGTVLENKADYYSSRIPKKLRKRTIVEELMADAEFRTKQRKKFEEIKAQQAITRKGAFQHRTYRRRKKHSMKKHH